MVNWLTKKLGEICDFISGNQNINKSKATTNGKYPAYSASGQDIFLDAYEHEGPAIIVSWIGARCGKCFLAGGKWTAIANTQILKIKNEDECDYKYLFYFLNDEKKWPRVGGAQPYISKPRAKKIEIPLPPLHIQKRIVARIEDLFEKIDKAKELRKKIIEKTKELKKSMMAELFKYGGPSFRKGRKLKKTEIGEIPENWDVVRLGEIVNIFDKKRIPLSEQQRRQMKGIYPYCGANGVIDYVNDYIFEGEYVLLAEDGGDWSKFGNSSYIMRGKFWVNNHAHVLQAKEGKALNYFLSMVLNYLDLSSYISGTTRGKLNQEEMKGIILPLPPLSEQREIAEILQTIDQKIEKLKKLQEEQLKDLEELKKSILEKAFKGELL